MTDKPTFDPARSEAMRRMLVETVAADQASAGSPVAGRAPSSGPAHRRRVGVVVIIAVLAGLVGSGTTALALNGQAWFGASAPAPTTAAPSTSAPAPTSTPTSAPPTVSAPVNPPAPVIRVPATCDQLAPVAESEAVLDTTLTTAPSPEGFNNPVFYTDRRLGGLACEWTGEAVGEGRPASVYVGVMPGITDDQYADLSTGIDWGAPVPYDEGVPSALAYCQPVLGYYCSFLALINGYGVVVSVANPSRTDLTETQRADARDLSTQVIARVAALGAPGPLWQPEGRTLTGATDCEGLASHADLGERFDSSSVSQLKADAGENDFSVFHAGSTVGAYWCSWALDDRTSTTVNAGVLPGGASYFAEYRAGSDLQWSAAPDYPGEAYLAEEGSETHLTMLIDGGWVELGVPTEIAADTLPGFAATVLANVGAE